MNKLVSPIFILSISYVYVVIIIIALYLCGLYEDNSFFSFGPPIKFFGKDIEDKKDFYLILVLLFFHQVVNNLVNSVVYPWIINSVQDPKNKDMDYSDEVSLCLINLFDIYSQIDVVFIIAGFMSQISFVVIIIFANMITSTYINNKHLKMKRPLVEIN